ncbi:MAG: DUF4251 domain-containing protein [Bacteroidota bacterium]|nr:DUF4251 domain-containing protein [Bacteroidota bacterium]
MKYHKYTGFWTIGIFLLMFFSERSIAQDETQGTPIVKKLSVKDMVDSQQFVFEAQSVNPMRGGFRMLTSLYDVKIYKDTLISDLPYFGRAYVAAYNPTKSELDFTTINISYSVSPYKKTGWYVVVKPKKKSGIEQYAFTIFEDGTASLSVTSTSRDPISFNGHIKTWQKKKKK